VAVDTELW
jgi:hypothetical protein